MEFSEELKECFETHPPRNSNEAKEKIKEITGIERCPTLVRIFMKAIGMQIRKVGFISGKAGTPGKQQEQDSFKKTLEPLLEKAKSGKVKVYFVDAAHFVPGTYLGYLCCFTCCFIKSPSGRNRFHVLGALGVITKEIITIVNETYINAESVCALMEEITK